MTIKEMMMSDIEERMAAIKTEMENRDADLDALTEEVRQLKERRAELEAQAEKRRKLEDDVRENGVTTRNLKDLGGENEAEARAKQFAETGKTNVKSEEVRSVLVSGGKLATPTQVSGINDSVGKKVSSIIDLVKIVNCTGMGSNKVAYIDTDAAAADGPDGRRGGHEVKSRPLDSSPSRRTPWLFYHTSQSRRKNRHRLPISRRYTSRR